MDSQELINLSLFIITLLIFILAIFIRLIWFNEENSKNKKDPLFFLLNLLRIIYFLTNRTGIDLFLGRILPQQLKKPVTPPTEPKENPNSLLLGEARCKNCKAKYNYLNNDGLIVDSINPQLKRCRLCNHPIEQSVI